MKPDETPAPIDVRALFAKPLKELAKRTDHRPIPAEAALREHGANPTCGDRIELGLSVPGASKSSAAPFDSIGFEGTACLLCTASAAALCELLARTPRNEAPRAVEKVMRWLEAIVDSPPPFDTLLPLAAVVAFPARVPCVVLPWITLQGLLARVP